MQATVRGRRIVLGVGIRAVDVTATVDDQRVSRLLQRAADYWSRQSDVPLLLQVTWRGWLASSLSSGELLAATRDTLGSHARHLAGSPTHDAMVVLTNCPLTTGNASKNFLIGAWPVARSGSQDPWRWCGRCSSLYFAGHPQRGKCVDGTEHAYAGSQRYTPIHAATGAARWCRACEAMWMPTDASTGWCPGSGAGHLTEQSGGRYHLAPTLPDTWVQGAWTRCTVCLRVVHTGAMQRGCKDDRSHQPSSQFGVLTHAHNVTFSWLVHELGHTLGMHHGYSNALVSVDPGSDPDAGAYGDTLDVMGSATLPDLPDVTRPPRYARARAWQQGWIHDSRVVTVRWNGTRTSSVIYAVGAPSPRPILLRLIAPRGVYGLEIRPPTDEDLGLGTTTVHLRRYFGRYAAGRDGWRQCTSCSAIIDVNDLACAHGGIHSLDPSARRAVPWETGAAGRQPGWRWCRQCNQLWHAGSGSGVCAGGDGHRDDGSGGYALTQSDSVFPFVEYWRYCDRCHALVRSPSMTPTTCAAGGDHDVSKSSLYTLSGDGAGDAQSGWNPCSRCGGLVFANGKPCATGASHTFDELNLAAEWWSLQPGVLGTWRCRKCHGLFTRPLACPGGGTHEAATDSPEPGVSRGLAPSFMLSPFRRSRVVQFCEICCQFWDTSSSQRQCKRFIVGEATSHHHKDPRLLFCDPPQSGASIAVMQCSACASYFVPSKNGPCFGGGLHAGTETFHVPVDAWEFPTPSISRCIRCGVLYAGPGRCAADGAGAPINGPSTSVHQADPAMPALFLGSSLLYAHFTEPKAVCADCALVFDVELAGRCAVTGTGHRAGVERYAMAGADLDSRAVFIAASTNEVFCDNDPIRIRAVPQADGAYAISLWPL